MKKRLVPLIILVAAAAGAGVFVIRSMSTVNMKPKASLTTSSVRFVSSTITADGTVTAQDQAKLQFQTAGKLVYLPFKEGDKVSAGQVIAQLDTYSLQRALTSALNTYRSTRDTFDQYNDSAANGVAKSQLTYPYNNYANAGVGGDTFNTAITNAIHRIADQNQASLDNSVINVELANYAMQLARLTSPVNGVITHEDVTVPGINITAATSFTVMDPDTMVFRANVPTEDIYYIQEGGTVTIALDGIPQKITGTVVKIYPTKTVLADGESVYQVDIASDTLKKTAKLDQAGTAIIETNAQHVALVPAWTVLSGKYIWVDNGGTPELRTVRTGQIHGNDIEVTAGLSESDRIIIDPMVITAKHYQML